MKRAIIVLWVSLPVLAFFGYTNFGQPWMALDEVAPAILALCRLPGGRTWQ